VKVDLPPPVTNVAGSDPTPAANPSGKKPAELAASPASAGAPDVSLSSSTQQPQQLAVSYHVAENGHKVYFKVVDENTGRVVLQVPPSAELSSEEKLYQFLQNQRRGTTEAKTENDQ
jgi:FlaG protein